MVAGPGCPSRDQVVDVSGQLLGGVAKPSSISWLLETQAVDNCALLTLMTS